MTTLMDVGQYRRAYFALCRELGIDDEMRHAMNLSLTGQASTRDWGVEQWRIAVADLQIRAGQKAQPGRPRLRGGRRGAGEMISPGQLEMISNLASQIIWKISAEAFVRARLLKPLRRETWDGRWESLFRREAINVIAALRNMMSRKSSADSADSTDSRSDPGRKDTA